MCFCSKLYTIEATADDADKDLFCKMANPRHRVNSLLPPIKSCNVITASDPKHIYMNCPDVTLKCIKVICTTLSL